MSTPFALSLTVVVAGMVVMVAGSIRLLLRHGTRADVQHGVGTFFVGTGIAVLGAGLVALTVKVPGSIALIVAVIAAAVSLSNFAAGIVFLRQGDT